MNPLVSISVPCYNIAPYLRHCLDSIIAQTVADWECICVDDGSTDDSGAILDEYAAKDPRFKVIHQKNGGVGCARQAALDAAQGKWLASVDADDWLDADYLGALVADAEASGADMVWSDYLTNRTFKDRGERSSQEGADDATVYLLGLLSGRFWGAMWNKLYSRDFVQRHNLSFLSGRITVREDTCFAVQFLSKKPKIHYVPVCGYHYYLRDGSALRSRRSRENFHADVCVQRVFETLDLPAEAAPIMAWRRREVMFAGSACEEVTAQDLREAFPEVRSLGVDVSVWHRAFYWLSFRGFRWFVVLSLASMRILRTLRRPH